MINKMKGKKMRTGIKTAILILSVLLAVSVAALAGTLIYRHVKGGRSEVVTVPDNMITPHAVSPTPAGSGTPETETAAEADQKETPVHAAPSSQNVSDDASVYETEPSKGTEVPSVSSESPKKAAVISLYQNHAQDNQPFQVPNLFPGDTETKYYCVRISHSGDVVVHYRADVRDGYEKLAEVLRCRVVLMTTGETLYDGLMRDMPESLKHGVKTDTAAESELYYAITAYLDTDVGNAYQNQELIADFRWWVQDTGNLNPPPTGDSFQIYLWIGLACGSLLILILLLSKRRREECENV